MSWCCLVAAHVSLRLIPDSLLDGCEGMANVSFHELWDSQSWEGVCNLDKKIPNGGPQEHCSLVRLRYSSFTITSHTSTRDLALMEVTRALLPYQRLENVEIRVATAGFEETRFRIDRVNGPGCETRHPQDRRMALGGRWK